MLQGCSPRGGILNLRQRHSLPFTVKVVTTKSELDSVVALRSAAYLRHNAPAADKVRFPEEEDEREDAVILVARSKLEGGVVGTMRINSNLNTPLQLESVMALSVPFNQSRCAEFMRLGVVSGSSGRLVSSALAKAGYEICVAMKMDFVFVCSRPPVDTMYRGYKFDDLLKGEKLDLHYAPGVPHFVLCIPVAEAPARWLLDSGPVYRFFIETEHPDLEIDYDEVQRRFARRAPADVASEAVAGAV